MVTEKKTAKKTVSKAAPKTVKAQTVKVSRPKTTSPKTEVKKEVTVSKPVTKTSGKSLTVDVLGKDGKKVGTVSLKAEIFGAKVNPVLMAQAVRVYLSNQRQGNAATKTRSEVAGTTHKVWQQKGTGRARHGSRKGPVFVGGGIVHGPHPHGFDRTLPQKARKAALASALTSRLGDQKIMVVELGQVSKTKEVVSFLKVSGMNAKKVQKVTVVTGEDSENIRRASRNIEGVTVIPANCLNTYEVLNSHKLVFMKNAVEMLENTIFK